MNTDYIQQTFIKDPRPQSNDKRVVEYVVDKLFNDFLKWVTGSDGFKVGSANSNEIHPEQQAVVRSDLYKAIENCLNDDGYEIAKELERVYYPDAELVELLDGVGYLKYDGLKEIESLWIKENKLTSPFAIGDKVTHKSPHVTIRYKGVGEVTKNDDEHGYSHVYFQESGHVKSGVGTHAGIIKWEELEEVK